jgi:hypothetical protein
MELVRDVLVVIVADVVEEVETLVVVSEVLKEVEAGRLSVDMDVASIIVVVDVEVAPDVPVRVVAVVLVPVAENDETVLPVVSASWLSVVSDGSADVTVIEELRDMLDVRVLVSVMMLWNIITLL